MASAALVAMSGEATEGQVPFPIGVTAGADGILDLLESLDRQQVAS